MYERNRVMDQKKLSEQNRKAWWTNTAICLLVIIGFTLYRSMSGEPASMVELGREGMTLNSTAGETVSVVWDQIGEAEVRSDVEYGTCISGTDTAREKSGVWQNDEFGEYDLYINPKIKNCVVCRLDSGRYVVVNIESDKTTQSLYEQIVLMLEE